VNFSPCSRLKYLKREQKKKGEKVKESGQRWLKMEKSGVKWGY
jgi:hypothetical protein